MTSGVPEAVADGRAPTPLRNPRIAILMATFCGERFLSQQLDTIAAQSCSDWALRVSDDRSTDRTLGILESYRANWGRERLSIQTGPALGFRANFLSLVCDPLIQAEYFAYADQDDLWDAEKLAVAVRWLESVPATVPALYCARTRLIDEAGDAIGFSPLFSKAPKFENALVQSIAGGNTMVFNRAARALLVEAGAQVLVQTHDWWTYILVSACGGTVRYDAAPGVGYRQHGLNLVGSNASWRGRYHRARRLIAGEFKIMNDRNIAALQRMRHRFTPESARVLDEFTRARDATLIPRLRGVRRSGVYCQTPLSSAALLGSVLLKKL